MKKLNVLLIDDDEIERMKFSRACLKNQLDHKVFEAENGEKALEFLSDATQMPQLILLDLNMPKMNGLEFLKKLKKDKELNHIPVIITTTSSNYNDLKECYKVGIAGYVIKPLHYSDYVIKVKKILDYWSINELIET